jgi:acetoin utilization protein AcuC
MSGREAPVYINEGAREVLLGVDWEEFDEEDRSYMYERLLDEPRTGEIRSEVKDTVSKMKALIYS